MRIIRCQQGSDEWVDARMGIATASRFSEIITPKTRKRSGSFNAYLAELVGEWFLGRSLSDTDSAFMERGRELEPRARNYYALMTGSKIEQIGICLTDDGSIGASPDSLVNDDGLLEVKCLSAKNHIYHVVHGVDVSDYWCQVQGQLWVTGRRWVDLLLYNPSLPSKIHRVEPDAGFQKSLGEHLHDFVVRLDAAKAELRSERDSYRKTIVDDVPAELS